ncbi:MAG: EFR1 family ferrodoxin [Firmicutes bacterium]|nr:EFR1 family ferrodoxin [Bacillota bacterium]
MKISNVQLIYFSPTGGTKKLAQRFASLVAGKLDVPVNETKLMAPADREKEYSFAQDELVILACPTYADRVPNKIAPDLRRILHFDGSPAVAFVSFGNRSFGTAPDELADILRSGGAKVIGLGAFVTRHVFNDNIAKRRPDREDKQELEVFAEGIADKLRRGEAEEISWGLVGEYYKPLKEDGNSAVFLKAKPLTREEDCYHCGLCVKMCPMGSIDTDCVTVSGVCIKCQACVRSCPTKAKYFDDADFLSHVRMLERECQERAENKVYL